MSLIVSKKYSLDDDDNYENACDMFSDDFIEWQDDGDMGDGDYYQYEQILGCDDRFCVLYNANDDEIARVLV